MKLAQGALDKAHHTMRRLHQPLSTDNVHCAAASLHDGAEKSDTPDFGL